MKNVKINNFPKKITFNLTGSRSDLNILGEYLNNMPQMFIKISNGPYRLINTENSDYCMGIECPEATYEAVIALIQDYISKE